MATARVTVVTATPMTDAYDHHQGPLGVPKVGTAIPNVGTRRPTFGRFKTVVHSTAVTTVTLAVTTYQTDIL